MTVPEAAAALIGSTIGALAAVAGRGRAGWWAAAAAVFGFGAGLAGLPGPVVSVSAATAMAASLVDLRWTARPGSAHRQAKRWDRATVRRVVAAETFGRPAWAVPALAVAIALGAASAQTPLMAGMVVVGPITAWLRRRRTIPGSAPSPPSVAETEAVVVIHDGSEDRSVFERVVDDLVGRGQLPAVAVSPPHLFRGLAGWNLGLGLDAERAAWAGQLARSLGLEPILAEPEWSIDTVQAQKLAVCRALASAGEVLVLDEPTAGMEPHDVKLVAAVVQRALDGRRLIVVTGDIARHRAFASKVRSRT